ncbi:MAG: hypothetical protein NTW52_01155 [Planctomycetota bacterium]|nr:hypothetical protein [Planctomycetota bacterium]
MRLICLFALSLSLVANSCFAGSLSKGDVIKLDRGNGAVQGSSSNGGEFSIWKQVSGGGWEFIAKTFCLEFSEYFALGESLKVGAVSDSAFFSGTTNPLTADPLNSTTKFLYDSYMKGTLSSFVSGYQYGNADSAAALQNAIWSIEGERALTGTGNDILAQSLITYASDQVAANPSRSYPVLVLNLFAFSTPDELLNAFNPLDSSTWAAVQSYRKQDQLYYAPEPTSIAIFALGLTLVGANRIRSRFRKA